MPRAHAQVYEWVAIWRDFQNNAAGLIEDSEGNTMHHTFADSEEGAKAAALVYLTRDLEDFDPDGVEVIVRAFLAPAKDVRIRFNTSDGLCMGSQ